MDRMIHTEASIDFNNIVIRKGGGDPITDGEGNIVDHLHKYSRIEMTLVLGFKSFAPITDAEKKIMSEAVLMKLSNLEIIAW